MSKLDELLWHMNAQCSDGSCIFRPSDMQGVVTNGGCDGGYDKKHRVGRLVQRMKSNGRFYEED